MQLCAIHTPTQERFLLPVLMLVPCTTAHSPAGAALQGEPSHAVPLPLAPRGGGPGPQFPGDLKPLH